MKNRLLALVLTFSVGAYSQTPYQNGATVSADGITFEVKLTKNSFVLRNTTNTRSREANWRYKDGRVLETLDEYAVVGGNMKPGGEDRALRESLMDSDIKSLRRSYSAYEDSPMAIFYVIGPDGDTLEVTFIMHPVPELVSLPPEVFAALDRNLKKYVKWDVNAYGQQLEFMQTPSFIHFRDVPLNSELHHIKPDLIQDSDLVPEITK